MFNPVVPGSGRPIFLRSHTGVTFTRLAVDRVTAADGEYDVMFIGTGERQVTSHGSGPCWVLIGPHVGFSLLADVGSVLKVISVPKHNWLSREELVLEELQVFQVIRADPGAMMKVSGPPTFPSNIWGHLPH